ncbi:DinB family protein [bacterium]|nr:DinB family protein [bacterium]
MLELLQRMFAYDRWANRQMLATIKALDSPGPRLTSLFAHLCGSKRMWLGRINANEDALATTWPEISLEDSEKLLELLDELWSNLLATLEDGDLAREVHYTMPDGKAGMQTLGDIITHSMLHSQYHRGQLASRIREQNGSPPSTDFVVWRRAVREGLAD